ncbi:MAG: hypothetical protein OQK82_05380 [Candidatus Pacearchaeota archaeon]|nr:hypothetical protein [Candidatus Pacearchaeota archaeon]
MSIFVIFGQDASIAGDARINAPGNIRSIKLGTCNGSSADSIEASASNVYGPYNLSYDRTRPMYTGFKFFTHDSSVISATDSLAFLYQIVDGSSISDTSALWTTADTITGVSADTGAVVDISDAIGGSIFFKLKNLQSADTAVVYNPIRVLFKEASEARVGAR